METLRIAVVSHDYPTPGSHAGAFVQARVDLYRRMGHEVEVHSRQTGTHIGDSGMEPDIIAAHYPLPEFVIPEVRPWFERAPAIVAYLHGAEAIRTPDKALLWGIRAKHAVLGFLRHADRAVTCSRWMQGEVLDYLACHAEVIPNPVDPLLFPLMLHEGNDGLCLRGRARKYGTDLIAGLDVANLQPTYTRAELPGVLRQYAFFVAPSLLEGQGLMACEAAATGMPVVSTKVGGIPEFIRDPESVLVEPEYGALREAIDAVRAKLPLSDARRQAVRQSILSTCGPEVTVEKDIALFREVLDDF